MLIIEKWLPRQFLFSLRWQFISNAAQGVFGGLYLILLGRVFGVNRFGTFSLAASLIGVAFLFMDFRLHEVVIRFVCPSEKSFNSKNAGTRIADLLFLDFMSRGLVLVIIIILLPIIRRFEFMNAPANDILMAYACAQFISKAGNSSALGLIRVMNRFDTAAKLIACEWFLKLVSLAILAKYLQPTIVQAVILAGFIGMLSNLTLITLAIKTWHKIYPATICLKFSNIWSRFADTRRYIISNLGISLSDLLVKDLDVALTGAFVTVEAVGIYKMTKNVVQMMWRVIDPFFLVLMPELRKMHAEGNADALLNFIKKVARILVIVSLIMFALTWTSLILFGTRIFGDDFANVSAIFPFMSIWVVLAAPLIWAHPLAAASGHPEFLFIGTLAANIVGLSIFVPLVYFIDIIGAGIAWSFTSILSFLFTVFLCRRAGLLNKESIS